MRESELLYKGGIFVNFSKGLCSSVSEIDIVSAYPSIIKNLPDMFYGYWTKVSEMNASASFGIYHVNMQFDGFSPFRSNALMQMIYPKTEDLFENYITAPEVQFLRKRGFLVQILGGYEFIHTSKPVYPFSNLIDELFSLKDRASKSKDESAKNLAKTIMNACYGKFAQSKHGLGILFNPVYATYITALTRIRIVELAEKYFSKIYEIATDAVIGILRTDIEIPFSDSLGGFELKHRFDNEIGDSSNWTYCR